MNKSIEQIVLDGYCCSCGICVGVCPKTAIILNIKNGIPTPEISMDQCINCGLCLDVCPGKSGIEEYVKLDQDTVRDYCLGSALKTEISRVKNMDSLAKSTSGGIATAIISELIQNKEKYGYSVAFLVKTDCFSNLVKSEICYAVGGLEGSEKSRYISVSHEDAVRYILSHKKERVIITGTGCSIQGFNNIINKFSLNRHNYLLIGLFCDKLMSYRVWEYFAEMQKQMGGLNELYFRDKEHNGWPGDMKLVLEGGVIYLSKRARGQAKDFFCHPRCLYCLDKLNRYSDIAIGDNYTGENSDSNGSSSVIIRTESGLNAYNSIRKQLVFYEIEMDKISRSQEIEKRKENLAFVKSKYGRLPIGSFKLKLKYRYKLFKISIGNWAYRKIGAMKFFMALDKKLKF